MNSYLLRSFVAAQTLAAVLTALGADQPIPLPEHPRPDFERVGWTNLNGAWKFRPQTSQDEKATEVPVISAFPQTITVPFPWGSELSGVKDKSQIAWYAREVGVPESWDGQRVFLVIGASDWETRAWLDGQEVGTHRGGYTPFEFELTPHLKPGKKHQVVLRVDDTDRAFKLEGKQGYGNARGIWQTVYLEARPKVFIERAHFSPDIKKSLAELKLSLSADAPSGASVKVEVFDGYSDSKGSTKSVLTTNFPISGRDLQQAIDIPNPRLWSLDDPHLYQVRLSLAETGGAPDVVWTYFGMRKIGVMHLPGTEFPYISLNDQPVYLQITLDQSYHPEGFYTFPSDDFMREEILRSRRIGLNANRFHVKIEVPRKLFWADRLGLLVMADVPNSWGEPTPEMRQDIEHAFRGMVRRDFNHPSIFAWVPFNETWGLFSGKGEQRKYLPETQEWVASIYRLGKQLDSTRLVEDNSPCNYDHVETDINSWHAYLPGYAWREHLEQVTRDTYPGSKWNFIGGREQGRQPLLNSECGNVWGYEGSTGDCDWSWDYHIMMNEFRRQPKVCGWLYTEHHDVINEWNGYYRFDRSEKFTGLEELVSGMSLRDLHAPFYISLGRELSREVEPGQEVEVPVWASFMVSEAPSQTLRLRTMLTGWDSLGRSRWFGSQTREVEFKPWLSRELAPLEVRMPEVPCLAILATSLEDSSGNMLQRNFTTFVVRNGAAPRSEEVGSGGDRARVVRFAPSTFSAAQWSRKQWNVLDGLKVNGAGHGFFEYRLPWPKDLDLDSISGASLVFEASAKQLFGKDKEGAVKQEGDFMLGKGTHDPSLNPNSYPMTDTLKTPSAVRVRFGSLSLGSFDLPDDPADHRGILSWHFQKKDKRLREAGSYGYLVNATVPLEALRKAAEAGELLIRFEVDPSLPGGLALYGESFGRYPLDPTLVLSLRP